MTTKRVEVTLAVRASARFPYYAVRVLGPRAGLAVGELAVPLVMDFNAEWFRRRTAPVFLAIPITEEPTVKVGLRSE